MTWDEEWMRDATPGTRPETWRHWLVDMVPCRATSALAANQIAKYSAAIGHSLEYELVFEEQGRTPSPTSMRSRF